MFSSLSRRRKSKLVPAKPRLEMSITRRKEPVHVCSDGREVCNLECAAGKREYLYRLTVMVRRQMYLCPWCKNTFGGFHHPSFDHERPRGMGAAHRNDALMHDDGVTWRNAALCTVCNGLKGSQHFHWVDHNSKYVPLA